MAEGMSRVAGSGIPIHFDGVDLVLPALNIQDYGVVEQHILSNRINPIEAIKSHLNGLSPEAQNHLLSLAYDEFRNNTTVSLPELSSFLSSREGTALSLWLLLERAKPGKWTRARVKEILESMTDEDVTRLLLSRDQAAGVDDLGNSTGQTLEKKS